MTISCPLKTALRTQRKMRPKRLEPNGAPKKVTALHEPPRWRSGRVSAIRHIEPFCLPIRLIGQTYPVALVVRGEMGRGEWAYLVA